ncbi:TonB-dependent receptor [Undibacterium sp. Jales W-56]|uniref:TonB-dependent receptor domain-containing protein n=1 Tax=Undibacterium sp. Jales W-56 TaxID=2897325 RepID=UPI0021D240D4|nr:TonB-dependent receptor [Undibacterium sp. Jales W-56]MCU6433018.1 TonB-dependent receptor [Undibacterium sp. Jales W-56]
MTSSFKPLAISVAVAAIFPSVSAFAQSTQNFDTSTNVVITAGRQVQAAKDVLADNVVITAAEIAKSGAASIVDLLQQQRGIEIARNGGPGTISSVFIRGGANAQNVVLVDGIRIGSSTLGGATWSAIPLSQIERIEIVYGPLSSLYGADAMGGVVQIFTKKGSAVITPTATVGLGSYGLRKAGAGISGATAGNVSFALNVGHEEEDGFSATRPSAGRYYYNPDKDGYTLDSVSGRLGYEVATGHDLGISFLQSRLNAQFDAGPGYDDRNIQKLETLAIFTKNRLASNWLSTVQIAETADKGFTDASFGPSQFDTRQTSLNWQNDISFGKDVLQLVYEHRKEKVQASTQEVSGNRTTNSLAGSYVFKQDAHLVSASARYDDSSQYGSKVTGSVAYGYRLSNALRVNASYGTSFRAPTFNELYYPYYGISTNKPEQAKNTEIGIYYEDGVSQFSAVYYSNKARDLLVYANLCPVEKSSHPYGCAYNVNKATLSGLTLGGSTRLGDLSLRGSLDIQDPKDDTTGLRLARRSTQHGSLAAEYSLAKTKLGVEAVFSGDRFDDMQNTQRLGGYSLLNLYATYDVAANWSVIGRWNNALNKDYELAKGYTTIGSNVFVGVNYGFK